MPKLEFGPEARPRHYSEKGGHFMRGIVSRQRRALESKFPDLPFVPPSSQEDYGTRRFMMRNPASGKGRRG